MYYDDFYDNYSEFDQLVDEFKSSLLNSVKQEYIDKMNELEKENSELQDVKKNLEEIKQEYEEKKWELEREKQDCSFKAKRMRLSELMKDFELVMYKVGKSYTEQPKCNKCDDSRRIKFNSPSGKDLYEKCECSEKDSLYTPEEYYCHEFRISRDNSKMLMWYRMRKSEDYDYCQYDSSTLAEKIYNETMNFEEIDRYIFFKSKDECQKYCDWLNEKESKGAKISNISKKKS